MMEDINFDNSLLNNFNEFFINTLCPMIDIEQSSPPLGRKFTMVIHALNINVKIKLQPLFLKWGNLVYRCGDNTNKLKDFICDLQNNKEVSNPLYIKFDGLKLMATQSKILIGDKETTLAFVNNIQFKTRFIDALKKYMKMLNDNFSEWERK